jgi:hypothetical protein
MATRRSAGVVKRIVTSALVLTCALLPAASAMAQEPKPNVQLVHQPLAIKQIPAAGTLMPMSIQLANSQDVDIKIRLVGSRDGRFMDIAFPMGVFNNADRPTYTINVPAPTAVMTYQFIVHQPNGELTLTPKYSIQRGCIQNYRVNIPNDHPSAEYRRDIATLIAKARSLERDTARLDTAIRLIENLKKDLSDQ